MLRRIYALGRTQPAIAYAIGNRIQLAIEAGRDSIELRTMERELFAIVETMDPIDV